MEGERLPVDLQLDATRERDVLGVACQPIGEVDHRAHSPRRKRQPLAESRQWVARTGEQALDSRPG